MEEVKKASTKTQLRIGEVKVDIGLYKAIGDPPKSKSYETAGPNGHPLRAVQKVVEAPVEEQAPDDPLGVRLDPGSEAPMPGDADAVAEGAGLPRSDPGAYRQILVEEVTGDEVPKDAIRRGIRRDDGTFVDLTDQLVKIEEDSRLEAMEILHFEDDRHVPSERVIGSYFVGSGGTDAPRVLRVLREALADERRVAVVRWTKRKGQTLGVLRPHPSGGLLAIELAWSAQARRPNAACLAHLRAEVTTGEVEQARNLVRAMHGKRADLDTLTDRRWQAENELLARAEEGELDAFEIQPEEAEDEMADLEELLAKSIA